MTTGAAVGPPTQPLLTGAGVAQAMLCRLKAAWIPVMCGVPSARLPLSSSTARTFMYPPVARHPPLGLVHSNHCTTGPLPM